MDKRNLTDDLISRIRKFVPGISLDCVVFGYRDGVLKVLLLKYYNVEAWGLPGGFLQSDMEMHQAVNEVLYKRTGLRDVFLTQYHTFSSLNRGWDVNKRSKSAINQVQSIWPEKHKAELEAWFYQRFISTAFLHSSRQIRLHFQMIISVNVANGNQFLIYRLWFWITGL